MNFEVFITCAITGAGDMAAKGPHAPVTPRQVAEVSIEAARAGAAIAHIHVRNPETAKPARDVALYREGVERLRASDDDGVISLTAGMGARLLMAPEVCETVKLWQPVRKEVA